jgi:integrase
VFQLLERTRTFGDGELVFRSRSGTPVDPKNTANRYVRPVAKALGISLDGWHDFRHTLSTQLLKRYPTKVVAGLLGHSDVRTTLAIYQRGETEDFRAPLNEMATELLCDVSKSVSEAAWFVEKKRLGEPGRTRTSNPLIKSQLLYH